MLGKAVSKKADLVGRSYSPATLRDSGWRHENFGEENLTSCQSQKKSHQYPASSFRSIKKQRLEKQSSPNPRTAILPT